MGRMVKIDSMIRRMLKNLCCSFGWSYGVFWRFDQRHSMLLTLEDAYYEGQMGVEIERMLQQVHILGEGIIGEAAFTERHQWISLDDHDMSIRSRGTHRDEAELHLQFSAGIKTIALIHVESQGVLQFGSTEKIPESSEFLDQAKRLFSEVEQAASSLTFTKPCPSPLGFDYRGGDNSLISRFSNSENQFQMTAPCISSWVTEGLAPASFEKQLSSAMRFQDSSDAYSARQDSMAFSSGMTVQNLERDSMIASLQSSAPIDVKTNAFNNKSFCPLMEGGFQEEAASMCIFQEDFIPTEIASKASPFDLVLQWLSMSPDERINEQTTTATLNDGPSGVGVASVLAGMEESSVFNGIQVENRAAASIFDKKEKSLDEFSVENSLVCSSKLDKFWEDNRIPQGSGHSAISTVDPKCTSESEVCGSTVGPRKGLFSESGLQQLMKDIINSNSKDQVSTANKRQRTECSLPKFDQADLATLSCPKPMQSIRMLDKLTVVGSQKEAVSKAKVGLWIEDSFSDNARSSITSQSKRPEIHKKATKKKAGQGESTRPRPKDRQLIQDHLKVLKEIVPNSGKLSIDALLDRTIKHLLFLRSVTKYAGRLKHDDEPKYQDCMVLQLTGQGNGVALRENDVSNGGTRGGATWAYEVGRQTLVCPIIVEDLDTPGQMLIEMLCEERGFFLEIADIIRGFSLTILKGVMEVRENKIWARFIVEANENVTRMDIFMSLVDLLHQTTITGRKSSANEPGIVDDDDDGGIAPCCIHQQPLVSIPH